LRPPGPRLDLWSATGIDPDEARRVDAPPSGTEVNIDVGWFWVVPQDRVECPSLQWATRGMVKRFTVTSFV